MDLDLVIATHRRPLERHLRRRVGDPSLAEDLAQEVFLRAWLHAPAGLTDPRLRAWLYRVATNLAIDPLRARRRGAAPRRGSADRGGGLTSRPRPPRVSVLPCGRSAATGQDASGRVGMRDLAP